MLRKLLILLFFVLCVSGRTLFDDGDKKTTTSTEATTTKAALKDLKEWCPRLILDSHFGCPTCKIKSIAHDCILSCKDCE